MKHDPERDAAAYVSGVMHARRSRRFEQHLLSCEECWIEVRDGRLGRRLAESDRELAPQELRERVRAAIAATDPPRGRTAAAARKLTRAPRTRPLAVATALALVLAGGVVIATLTAGERSQPAPIAAALTDFETHRMTADVGHRPDADAPDLSNLNLTLAYSGAGTLDGQPVNSYWYTDARGTRVLVYTSETPFPVASGAWGEHDGAWRVHVDGVAIVCSSSPKPMLALSDDQDLLDRIAETIGMAR